MQAKKLWAGLLSIMLIVSCLAGCSGNGGNSSKDDSSKAVSQQESSQPGNSQEDSEMAADFTYPVAPGPDGAFVTLSINKEEIVRENVAAYTMINGKSYYYWDALEEATGIHLNFIGAVSDPLATSEATLLLITSQEYPDIWRVNWITHPGGPTGALNDELIVNLSDYSEQIPNLTAYMQENPDIAKMVVNDDGDLYCFPSIGDSEGMGTVGTGPIVRADWLEEQNLQIPVTIDDWTNTLRTFKGAYGANAGLTFEARWLWLEYASAALTSAWGVTFPFYVVNDEVKFGPMEEGYRQFVQQMADWYAEGLLDTDFATVDKSTVQAKFANSESGLAIQQTGNIENCVSANEGTSFAAAAVPTAVLKEGDTRLFGHMNPKYNGSFAHSVSPGENQELAMRWCDYLYSHEGQYLTAYGTEGITYTVDADGSFTGYTDLVLNNSSTKDEPKDILKQFTYNRHWAFPSPLNSTKYFQSEYVTSLINVWSDNEMGQHFYPAVTHTTDEVEQITNKYTDIETYAKENIVKFILGTQSMDGWDAFKAQMESLGIADVLAAKQAAYDRYRAR